MHVCSSPPHLSAVELVMFLLQSKHQRFKVSLRCQHKWRSPFNWSSFTGDHTHICPTPRPAPPPPTKNNYHRLVLPPELFYIINRLKRTFFKKGDVASASSRGRRLLSQKFIFRLLKIILVTYTIQNTEDFYHRFNEQNRNHLHHLDYNICSSKSESVII